MIEEQLNIFEVLYPKFKIDKPIRLIELFGGYGSQALALKYLGVKFEHWKLVEWAVKSIQAYKDIHFPNDNTDYSKNFTKEELVEALYYLGISQNYNEPMKKEQVARLKEKQLRMIFNNIQSTNNLVDIQQVKGSDLCIKDTNKFTYLLTYSFPCQDLSVAGKRALMSDTTTRSGLLWEVERVLNECKEKPQLLLMENVPQVHGEGALQDFIKWQNRLEEMGYKNYFQDLIATDYGIPQTRNRCFMISLLGDYSYTFPQPIPLKLKLKDLLEDNIDSKYYLSEKMIDFFIHNEELQKEKGNGFRFNVTNGNGIAKTITTLAGNRMDDNFIQEQDNKELEKYYLSEKMINYIFSKNSKYKVNDNNCVLNRDIACSKTTREGQTRIDTSDYICTNLPQNTCITNIPRVLGGIGEKKSNGGTQWYQQDRIYDDNVSISVTTSYNPYYKNDLRIRKLTPRECFRLMGVKDEDYDKCAKNQSDSSLYHLAGDSIVVDVLMAIFKEMIE